MIDFHAHTSMSYCAENALTPKVYAELVRTNPEVDAVYVTDHGMAVYFPSELAWSWKFITDSTIFDAHREWGNARLEAHLANLAKFRDRKIFPGLEVEMMHDGRLTLDDTFRERLDILIGSVHYLPVDMESDRNFILKSWERHTFELMNRGIDVLGHPFRWISNQMEIPRDVLRSIVKEARNSGIALELNGHYIIPTDIPMIQEAAEIGVPISIGTDAHSMSEIGNFNYHIDIIRRAGLSLAEIKLFSPKSTRRI